MWATARRILAVRLDTVGDVLMTTPALRALKTSRPDRHVALLTSSIGAEAARRVDEIDEAIVYDAPWLKATPVRADAALDHAMIRRLREARFDGAVIFTVYSQNPLPSALLCYLADIPLRLAHCRENPYQLLTDWVSDPEPEQGIRHEVRRQLDLVATIGCRTSDERLSLRVTDEDRRTARGLLEAAGIDRAREWVIVHPGARAASRRYPAAAFARACRDLVAARGCQLVFSGEASEARLIDAIRAKLDAPSVSLAGMADLSELGALLEDASLLISNNTGPVHVAAAVGTPVVDLYALTNPQHTPWAVASRVLSYDVPCKYCYKSVCPTGHHDCLSRIPPESVVAAACELLDGTALEPDAGCAGGADAGGDGGPSRPPT